MDPFKKVCRIGTVPAEWPHWRDTDVFVWINYDADGWLSLYGVEGPLQSGDCKGASGQILALLKTKRITPALDWTQDKITRLLEVWERWHLNDMRAGCEHQRKEEWHKRPIDPQKPLNTYGKHFPGQKQDSWNMFIWVRPDEHPDGLLMKPCPKCGHRYGGAWLKEEVPADVLEWLASLPDADQPLPGTWAQC